MRAHTHTHTHTHTINMYKKIHLTPLLHTHKWLKGMIILMEQYKTCAICGGKPLFHSNKKQEQLNDDQ